ncbi:MAG: dihydrofolate reductase [Geobacteraceae bacterium GWC2_58_44]|nr:MAG: dihydrofolate reductase [Geobacteraceae bacterium GWC2_58_44]
MIISLMAAMSENRVIGRQGKLPWHIPADLARFKSITMGHAVLMGRRTFESIGRPLPGRRSIVLTRTRREIEGCEVAPSLQEAIAAAEGDEEIFIIGGSEVFREALPLCQRIYLTIVHGSYQGDVYFPPIPGGFQELHREERPEQDPPISFVVFEKVDRIQQGADVQELRQKGREAIQRQLYFLARRCFEQALAVEENPETAAELAFCMVKSGGDRQAALRLAEKALQSESGNPDLYLNAGRVQVMAGAKEAGLDTLRKGVQLGGGQEFLAELARCGSRTPPPIRYLSRSHPLNRYLGLMLHRMGLR